MVNFFRDDTVFLKCQKSSLTQGFLDPRSSLIQIFLLGRLPWQSGRRRRGPRPLPWEILSGTHSACLFKERSHWVYADRRSVLRQAWGKELISRANFSADSRDSLSVTNLFTRPIVSASLAGTGRPVMIKSRARLRPIRREAYGSPVDQRDAPAATEDAQDSVFFHHSEVAPEGEFQASCHGMSRDGGDHRLGEDHAGCHRSVPLNCFGRRDARSFAGDRLEVSSSAEGAVFTEEDRDLGFLILFE